MNFVTRCTSCGTLFKVVADQLKISGGWVRCGQCATVFDAQSNLVDAADKPAATPPQAQPSDFVYDSSPEPSNTLAIQPDTQPHDIDDLASEISSFRANKWQDSGMLGAFIAASTGHPAEPTFIPSHEARKKSAASDEPVRDFPERVMDKSQYLDDIPLPVVADTPEMQEVAVFAPGFVVQAQRAQRWRSPWMRLALGLLCLTLLIVWAAQIAWYDKDRIAAFWPQTKPWLSQFCQHAGCKVQPFKRIEAIAMDASSFNRINKNNAPLEASTQSYRLAVTLKNTGTLPVALPHVELSLQDAQDVAVLRRVLSPSDLGSSLSVLAPSQDVAGSLTLQIDTAQLAGSRIQGYRVLAFYP